MKYNTEITEIGEMVEELLVEDMLIIFNKNVPEDLKEVSAIHEGSELKVDVAEGDTIKIGSFESEVTSVGETANDTLRELGHCTFRFDGDTTPNLPGSIHVKDKMPENHDVTPGSYITIS